MAGRIGGCDTNNELISEDMDNVKQEFEDHDYIDNKVSIGETTININSNEFNVDNVKTELSFKVPEHIIDDNVKIKDEVSAVDYIKVEVNNEQLSCDYCHEDYQDYCTKCHMLVHILNNNSYNGTGIGIPKDILEIRESSEHLGVFSLKVIPEGVKLGPFACFSPLKHSLKIKGGKLMVIGDKPMSLNWMYYINSARSISEQNLIAFQCRGHLYYRTNRKICEGEELLVYFGEKYEANRNEDVTDFIPAIESDSKMVFACTVCCLGFSSKLYLFNHKTIYHNGTSENFLTNVLTQCAVCQIYLEEKEYSEYHINYCSENKISQSETKRCSSASKKRTRGQRTVYKCVQCIYQTTYKGELSRHINNHHNVKVNGRGNFYLKFKRKLCYKVKFQSKHKYCAKKYSKTKPLENIVYKCTKCDFRTNYEHNLKVHVDGMHRKGNYKCTQCEFETKDDLNLEQHVDVKHLKKTSYKCNECDYTAKYKSSLEIHMKIKHNKLTDYYCTQCAFKTNDESSLKMHVNENHGLETVYSCLRCDFRTNQRLTFRKHIPKHNAKPLKKTVYECLVCDYKSSAKGNLKLHINAVHLKRRLYQCLVCDYKSSTKANLQLHINVKHLKTTHKCLECDFTTYYEKDLRRHMNVKHLGKGIHKCPECEYKAIYKHNLKAHIDRKHHMKAKSD